MLECSAAGVALGDSGKEVFPFVIFPGSGRQLCLTSDTLNIPFCLLREIIADWQSHVQLTSFRTNQKHWNQQAKSDWPLFSGSLITKFRDCWWKI